MVPGKEPDFQLCAVTCIGTPGVDKYSPPKPMQGKLLLILLRRAPSKIEILFRMGE